MRALKFLYIFFFHYAGCLLHDCSFIPAPLEQEPATSASRCCHCLPGCLWRKVASVKERMTGVCLCHLTANELCLFTSLGDSRWLNDWQDNNPRPKAFETQCRKCSLWIMEDSDRYLIATYGLDNGHLSEVALRLWSSSGPEHLADS